MTSEALVWNRPEANLDRHNRPELPAAMNHYGFRGYPDHNFHRPKQPVVAPPSADVQDVSHFFRKDSATQRYTPPDQQPPMSPMKQTQEPPSWLQSARDPPMPQQTMEPPGQLPPTISPRYEQPAQTLRPSDEPVIRDPRGEMSSAERKKKTMEAQVARENFDEDLRRKEAMKEAKREEQRKIRYMQENYQPFGHPGGGAPIIGTHNRKMKFTEHQLEKEDAAHYVEPRPIQYEDRGRSPMKEKPDSYSYNYKDRKEDLDRAVTMPLIGAESERYKTRGLLDDQERDISRLQTEINKVNPMYLRPAGIPSIPLAELKEQRAMESYREPPFYSGNERAHSEPLTDRPYRQVGGLMPEDYLGATPRRRPVGDMFQVNSTYMSDFDMPFNRPGGRRNLGNPNREGPFNTYWPFQRAGGGAPLVNRQGQRYTQIQGTMDRIGRELSDSARARKARNTDMLETLKRQKEDDRIKKMLDKERQQQGYVELASDIRSKKVGFPKYLPSGYIAQHHLPHTMSNPHERPDFEKMRTYKESLDEQTMQKQKDTRLAQLEAVQQARKHQQTLDAKFGPYIPGGGNRKGPDLRKVNLDKAIHQPQTSRIDAANYMGQM